MSAGTIGHPVRRLFKLVTPTDLICAAVVLRTLPRGQDVAAISYGLKGRSDSDYTECLRAFCSLHDWHAVVDLSGVKVPFAVPEARVSLARLRRVGETVAMCAGLRRSLAPAFGVDPLSPRLAADLDGAVDEFYFTCIAHPDVQALYGILGRALKLLSPHGFDAFTTYELRYYSRFFDRGERPHPSPLHRAADVVKRIAWGRDAAPVRGFELDGAFHFTQPAPWTENRFALGDAVNEAFLRGVFEALPGDVRAYFEGYPALCSGRPGLLLLSEEYRDPALELDGYAHVARSMAAAEGLSTVLVKPHPLGDKGWNDWVLAYLRREVPGVIFLPVERYHAYPIEVVVAPLGIAACGVLHSSAANNLNVLYKIPYYCPQSHVVRLWSSSPFGEAIIRDWIRDYGPRYVAV